MNLKPSNRIENIEESSTLAMSAKASEMKSKGIDVISLSLGEPDFKTPSHICDGAKKAIDSGNYFSYPPVNGYLDLREAISKKFSIENNLDYHPNNIIVSNGVKPISIAKTPKIRPNGTTGIINGLTSIIPLKKTFRLLFIF